jgi:hypothetical protein
VCKTMLREQGKLQLFKRFRQSVGPEALWAGLCTKREIGPVEEHNGIHLLRRLHLPWVDAGRTILPCCLTEERLTLNK